MKLDLFFVSIEEGFSATYDQFMGHLSDNNISNFPIEYQHIINVFRAIYHNLEFDFYKVEDRPDLPIAKVKTLDQLVNKFENAYLVLKTSGTTGKPKIVRQNIGNILRNLSNKEKNKNKKWLFCYSFYHMAGLQVLFQIFFTRSTLYYLRNNVRFQEAIKKYELQSMSFTPTYFRSVAPYVTQSLDKVETVTFGGEVLDEATLEKATKVFPKAVIRNIYASTEAGTLFKSNTIYFNIPDKLKDLIKFSENNELLIHKSLIGRSDSVKADWYSTGDIVQFEDGKVFKFVSRISDFINVGGYKVNPLLVESEIRKVNGVDEAVVYGIENKVTGQIVAASIQLTPNYSITKKEVLDRLKEVLQAWELPRIIEFVDNIKVSSSGKTVRLL